jgi:hypothetical protein
MRGGDQVAIGLGDGSEASGTEGGVDPMPKPGQEFIVKTKMPCRRESSGRTHATIHPDQQIMIVDPPPRSKVIYFGIAGADSIEIFSALPEVVERCCGDAKPVPKAE